MNISEWTTRKKIIAPFSPVEFFSAYGKNVDKGATGKMNK